MDVDGNDNPAAWGPSALLKALPWLRLAQELEWHRRWGGAWRD